MNITKMIGKSSSSQSLFIAVPVLHLVSAAPPEAWRPRRRRRRRRISSHGRNKLRPGRHRWKHPKRIHRKRSQQKSQKKREVRCTWQFGVEDDTSMSTIVKSGNNMYNYYGQEGGTDVVESLLCDESDLKRSAKLPICLHPLHLSLGQVLWTWRNILISFQEACLWFRCL